MRAIIVGLIYFLILSGCKSEKGGAKNMLKNEFMAVRCVGRHVISLPKNFKESSLAIGIFRPAGLRAQEPAFEVIIRAGRYTQQQFAAEVQKRRIEMRRGGGDRVNVLRLDKEFADGSILLRLQEIEGAHVSEINFLREGIMVTVRLDSYEDQYLQAEEGLIKFADGVKASQGGRSSGFCLGAVNIVGNFEAERGSFWFRDGQGSDFEVDVDTYVADEKVPLLERMRRPDSLLAVFDVTHKVLRARERAVAGMQAQEWLGWAKISDHSDEKTLKFALETMRSKPSRVSPSISLTFNTAKSLEDGTPTKTLVSDDEAMQLWDAVVESIRPAGA